VRINAVCAAVSEVCAKDHVQENAFGRERLDGDLIVMLWLPGGSERFLWGVGDSTIRQVPTYFFRPSMVRCDPEAGLPRRSRSLESASLTLGALVGAVRL
jgi:hypothetical protein